MKINSRFLTIALAFFALVLINPEPAQARAWEWAKRLPINQYSPEDIGIFKARMDEILSSLKDGETGKWSNPESGHGGSITPLNSVDENGKTCRKTQFKNASDTRENVSEFFLCKQPDGSWAVEQAAAQ